MQSNPYKVYFFFAERFLAAQLRALEGTLSCSWYRLHLQLLAFTNLHWACVSYGPFPLCVEYTQEDLWGH
jgi:hypothetical protein